ncbi:Crp/Fnr family transcriptional regulator [Methylomonas sp. MED-D]|uniref:Crp/Fnr family transcriptional regulator n=1 Tax=Methylomonas koyamae TaxID=702114 RepID=A0A177NBH9_9GAMM|nr:MULTISPECIES: Crp/Fnr family transcriptional regulator [Methylomonas]MDT4329041.1 Crp/Fnr family transcriptional regulator [Methylomonas sp. MV1]OAI14974.1 Crp/Fnr family transcriptional regulator [Methylomonas koyamae]
MQSEVLANLAKIPFLADAEEEALAALAAKVKTVKFPKRAMIIYEGDDTSSLYIVLSGAVRVFSTDDKDKEVTLLIQEAGSYFGELALLSNEPRSAAVQATENTVCGIVSKGDFILWLKAHPDVAITLLGVLAEKVRHLTEKVKQLALSNVYERTIKVLQDMAEKDGDIQVIAHKPTQQELANMVGSSREMINKIMKELTKGGYVVVDGKALKIVNKPPAAW